MNHNPHNLQEGQHVILDKKFRNGSEVVIHKLTPKQVYAEVYSAELIGEIQTTDMWHVMTNRLTPIEK